MANNDAPKAHEITHRAAESAIHLSAIITLAGAGFPFNFPRSPWLFISRHFTGRRYSDFKKRQF
jgi:hypothetical protein